MPFVLPECDKTVPERKKHIYLKHESDEFAIPACNISTIPGDITERGCTYAGCRGVVGGPVKDVIHLQHGPIGCAYYTWGTRQHIAKGTDFHLANIFSTDLRESNIVFGGEKKLYDAILESSKAFPQAQGVFVYATCVAGLIGDDIEAVAKRASKAIGKPVVAFNCPGFRGVSQSLGHHIGNQVLFDTVVGTEELTEKTPYDINLVGEYNIKGDDWLILSLLEKVGLRVVCTFTGDASIHDIAKMHEAKLNVIRCARSAKYIAEMMQEKYGTPFMEVDLYGIEQTANDLRKIAKFFGLEEKAEQVIAEEIAEIKPAIDFYKEKFKGKKVMVYQGGPRSWHWAQPMEELGMQIVVAATTFGHEDDYEKIVKRCRHGTLVIDNPNAPELEEAMRKYKPDLFISGMKEKYLAHKFGVPFLNGHNYESSGGYMVFKGLVKFAEDIYKALYAPAWKFVRKEPQEPQEAPAETAPAVEVAQ
ncbi:MAG: nitrogenase component I subunit alpha [Candidatus Bathyarchaeota archaeon]|nr:nitrogenase component I subunit alpha [Candidatus Bathyarchaeota archaeon]